MSQLGGAAHKFQQHNTTQSLTVTKMDKNVSFNQKKEEDEWAPVQQAAKHQHKTNMMLSEWTQWIFYNN